MRKIYQLKKTSYFVDDDDQTTRRYFENDDLSEEFYTTLAKAEKALENYVRELVGKVNGKYPNPWTIIKLFPRKHFTVKKNTIS